MEKHGGSGRVRVLGPDPTRQGLDPTRPAVFVNFPDPTQPDPTRPAGRPDPGTTLLWQIFHGRNVHEFSTTPTVFIIARPILSITILLHYYYINIQLF